MHNSPVSEILRLSVEISGTLYDALSGIDRGASGLCIVLDGQGKFVGVLSDGDVRRALLGGADLLDPILPYVRASPFTVEPSASRPHVLDLMKSQRLEQIPIVDSSGTCVGLHRLHDVIGLKKFPNRVFILAGGKGTRLGALTAHQPKPMLTVAGRPILEWIVLHLVGQGFSNITISVGHLADQIVSHFESGAGFGCHIDYVRDPEGVELGTAGPLALLEPALEPEEGPLVVLNGDLLVRPDISSMLDLHTSMESAMTVATKRIFHQLRFGIVVVNNERSVSAVEEKPTLSWEVNSGIYVIEPRILKMVPKAERFDMTQLIHDQLHRGEKISAWELSDEWTDIGVADDLSIARGVSV